MAGGRGTGTTQENGGEPGAGEENLGSPGAAAARTWSAPEQTEADLLADAVMDASRVLIAISARALASTGNSLTLPQLRSLVVLESCGPVKLAGLAATLDVNSSTALRMVERLESAGLVDRSPNPDNRREVVLTTTLAGRHLVERVMEHRRSEVAALVGSLTAEQRAGLMPALRALTSAAGTLVHPDEVAAVGQIADDPLRPPR